MDLFDTHCHIHSADYGLPAKDALLRAHQAGVSRLICVGTDYKDSQLAVQFAQKHDNVWASIAQHPHDAKVGDLALNELSKMLAAKTPKIVAIGECGLDYYYLHSSKKDQQKALRYQIELALQYNLPLIFHVRDAFDDFWPIFDSYNNIKGVVHCFTDDMHNLNESLSRGLFVGVNGIVTFTKNDWQIEVYKSIPLTKLLLETDAPYLTPIPHRGKVNEPAYVSEVAKKLANIHSKDLAEVIRQTTLNAQGLFLS